jgi:hypothetical protein
MTLALGQSHYSKALGNCGNGKFSIIKRRIIFGEKVDEVKPF